MLGRWMPLGAAVEPLALFRTLAVHRELMSRMRPLGSGILNHGEVSPRDRTASVSDELWAQLQPHYTKQQLLKLVVTAGGTGRSPT
jgi:hypothetical protein